jgi:DMSO/TMAO reductase YedYZ molybdopterin-dependent catalytic subunit
MSSPTSPEPHRLPALPAALAGVVASGAAITAGELGAGLVPGFPSPLVAIGRLAIDLQPPGAKELVVGLFGTADKLALQVLVLVVALAVGAGVGLLARTRLGPAMGVIGAFVGFGFLAALRDPATRPVLAVAAAVGELAVGATVLDRLVAIIHGPPPASGAAPASAMPDWDRRRLLLTGGGIAVASVVAGGVGRLLLGSAGAGGPAAAGALPNVPDPVSLPAGADLSIAGLTPIVVPNPEFYRIDTALVAPGIDRESWRLRVHGMVEREVTLSYADLLTLPLIEQYVTIACVSNRVGGDLVGNAKWTGVRLRDVLDTAGVKPGATQLVGRSADGWTAGSPTAWVLDPGREPMIAIGMNGAPLPREHGFPARVIIPGLYGYVSGTKWVTELELTTLEAFDAYWVPLGWSKEAPILTQSRIDRPGNGATVAGGQYAIAGVAWAPDRGIGRVDVQVDGGDWLEARLSNPISDATWVQWQLDWTAVAGDHTVRVRATDRTGETQSGTATRPDPDGARGWHVVTFTVG